MKRMRVPCPGVVRAIRAAAVLVATIARVIAVAEKDVEIVMCLVANRRTDDRSPAPNIGEEARMLNDGQSVLANGMWTM